VEGSHRIHGLRRKANRRQMNDVGGYSSTPLRGRAQDAVARKLDGSGSFLRTAPLDSET
jgi:hypothetical protein